MMKVTRGSFVSLIFVFYALVQLMVGQEAIPPAGEKSGAIVPVVHRPSKNAATPAMSQDELQQLVRVTAENDIANEYKARNYTYIEHVVQRKLGGKGELKSTETKTYEVMQLYGEQVARLVAKDGKPLSEKDAAKEEEKIQKLIKKRSEENANQRKKRLEKEAKDQEDQRKFVREICDAYAMRVTGVENVDGSEVLVIEGDPRPGFRPKLKNAKYLPKFRVRAWVDRSANQWVKLEAEAIDDITIGGFLARVNKGMHLEIEQTHVNDEVWLPQHVAVKVGGRALFKGFSIESDVAYRDYRKFRADVRISEPERGSVEQK